MKYLFHMILWASVFASTTATLAAVDPAVLDAEQHRVEVIEKASRAVVAVFSAKGGGGGSAVVISPDGLALTNFHVVQPTGHWMKCGMSDGKVYDAVLVGLDPTGDVALIKLFGRDDYPSATLGDSDAARAGDWVYAMGNPFLLATDLRPTVTSGILSGTHRYQYPSGTLLEYADCLQTDAAINPGNSGGPLFDAEGRLIGINGRCSFEKRGRVSVGVGYAISINQIKHFLGCLKSGRIVDHATLGLHVGFDSDRRVVVDQILESSDAYRRGVRYGDEMVRFAGRPIDSPNALQNAVGIYPKGWRLPLVYRRDGKSHEVLVRLAGLHSAGQLAKTLSGGPKPEPQEDPKSPKKRHPHMPRMGKEPEVPQQIKAVYTERRGYANYFFNLQRQRNLFDRWSDSFGPFDSASTRWTIAGTIATSGKPFHIELDDQGGQLTIPGDTIDWSAGSDLNADLAPQHSGGMLPALYLWRRLATVGYERFGQVYYYGTAPLAGTDRMAEVLIGTYGGVTARFYFDPAEGQLVALEMYTDDESDPCEIYWNDFKMVDGRTFPTTMEVRFGNEIFARFVLDAITFDSMPNE